MFAANPQPSVSGRCIDELLIDDEGQRDLETLDHSSIARELCTHAVQRSNGL